LAPQEEILEMMTGFINRLATGIANHSRLVTCLGAVGWLSLQAQLRSPRMAEILGHRLRIRGSRIPIYYRPGESDLAAFLQIFTHKEYESIGALPSDALIIDCGANVGYSSAWFATRFPLAKVISLEPDAGNFAVLERNLAQFGSRVRAVRGAVWSRECGLVFDRSGYRDGLSWSIRVREALVGETPEVRAYDIPSLMRMENASRIALLKIDIERAEIELFSAASRGWISNCDKIAIELHDQECERVFFEAIENEGFRIARARELTICERPV
jgi:FkbM family methyltransferase